MEMVLNNGFCAIGQDETMLIDGGWSTAQVAGGLVVAAGMVVGAVVGGAAGGAVGAAMGASKGAKIGEVLGGIVVGYIAEEATVALINEMSK